MKINFKNPDTYLQIADLQNLLQTHQPTDEDVALALFLILLIFYENRPGKLHGLLPHHNIYGTGCHNPTSEKTGKTIWYIWRLELTITYNNDSVLTIKHELMQGGYLKAVLKNSPLVKTITADIYRERDTTTKAMATSIKGTDSVSLLKDLDVLLKEPLEKLMTIITTKQFQKI